MIKTLAITGSRKYSDYETMKRLLKKLAPETKLIITGGANGADELAARYAAENDIELKVIRPDYNQYFSKVAPLIRNTQIVEKADKVIAFYYKKRKGGTLDTATKAQAAGKLLSEVIDGKVVMTNEQLKLL